jgi:hypothetical protein
MHGEAMVMGDLVLLETEVNPVMAKLIEEGVEITAVHNHLLRQSGNVLHAHRARRSVKMAEVIRSALALSRLLSIHRASARPQSISTLNSTRSSAPKAR